MNPYVVTPGAIILTLIAIIVAVLIQAFLVQITWNLSLAKIFRGVPCLSYGRALALVLLIDFALGWS